MSQYTPAIPNKFDTNLIPTKIRQKYFEEYIGLTPLSVFMGTSPSDVIQVFEMSNGEGMSFRVPFRKGLDSVEPVIGFNQAAGSGQKTEFYEDEIRLRFQRWVAALTGQVIVKQQTPIDVFGSLRKGLLELQQEYLVKSLLNSVTTDIYKNSATSGAGKDRVVYCGVDYKATIKDGVADMKGASYDKSGLSVDHIRKLKSMAISGGESNKNEAKIKPTKLSTKKGFPVTTYIYLMDNNSYNSLVKDPEWSSQMNRGLILADQPEGLSGANYRGTIEGVMIYQCDDLSDYRVESGSKKASWNLFMGAQAFGICWSKRPYFKMEQTDFDANVEMAVCEMRGQKALMFPSYQDPNKTVERGIIHSFVQYK